MPDDPSQFKLLTGDELRTAFLAAAAATPKEANAFFGRFKYAYDLFGGNYSSAVNLGLALLASCRAIDQSAYRHIHKGTAYYWIGSAAFLMQEPELAAFFFDAAVSEDLRAGAHPVSNPSPALRFTLIDAAATDQAARPLVEATDARIRELIDNYNSRPGRRPASPPLSLDAIRKALLLPSLAPENEQLRSLATTLISFSLEWDFRNQLLELGPAKGTSEPYFMHLFKGCVLFESLLRCNPRKPPQATVHALGRLLTLLRDDLGLPHPFLVGNATLPGILAELPQTDESLPSAIRVTARLRNTIGHNLGWVVALSTSDYHRLFRMVASSCLHAIGALYV